MVLVPAIHCHDAKRLQGCCYAVARVKSYLFIQHFITIHIVSKLLNSNLVHQCQCKGH